MRDIKGSLHRTGRQQAVWVTETGREGECLWEAETSSVNLQWARCPQDRVLGLSQTAGGSEH